MLGVRVVPLVGAEVGRVELLVKDQKEFAAKLMALQVGEVPRGAPMNEALIRHLLSLLVHLISELLQGLGHVPCAFRMTNPKNEELG